MTDKEKIAMLEKENRELRSENQNLLAKQQELAEIAEQMKNTILTIRKAQQEVEETKEALHRFKIQYAKACEEAMKTTVKPYAKALRVARQKRKKVKATSE